MRRKLRRAISEALEARQLLSGTYVVPEVSDIALSQPQIHYGLTRPGDSDALGGVFDNAFLDTGTSGNIESIEDANMLGIQTENGVVFNDVGISGQQFFYVAEPLQLSTAPYTSLFDDGSDSTFTPDGTIRMEVNPFQTADAFGDPINIIGMPAIMGKVMVINPQPLFATDDNIDDMRTYLEAPNATFDPSNVQDPGVPPTSLNVAFTMANFAPYTSVDPAGSQGPTLTTNPVIGPNPLRVFQSNPPPDNTPPVTMSLNGTTATGSFLFDTGAVGSFMSQDEAAKFGVFYRAGTYGSSSPVLVDANNNPIPGQAIIPYGGLDGSETDVSEFSLDSITLQTNDGTQIRFTNFPISVLDVNLTDPQTGDVLINPQTNKPFAIDGDFGVNPLLGSFNGGTVPAFNWITFNTTNNTIGFAPTGTISSGTASIVGRHLFYDNSFFDGHAPGASALDNNAIAPDKIALSSTAASSTFDNISSYPAGINGIMIDVAGLAGTPTATDFQFSIGNSTTNFFPFNTAPTVTVVPNGGPAGSTRIKLTWPDNTIRNEWLEVTMIADNNTGLPAPDTFLFGSLVGDSGQPTTETQTTYKIASADVSAAAGDLHGFTNPATLFNPHDYNRDGRVDITDQQIARYSIGQSLVILGNAFGFSQTPNQSTAGSGATADPVSPTPKEKRVKGSIAAPVMVSSKIARKRFHLRKQHSILQLKQLIQMSANIKDAKVRKQVVAHYKDELTAVRATTVANPGVLGAQVRL